MPIYEYKCVQCGKLREVLRSVELRGNPTTCDKCGNIAERIISKFNSPHKFDQKNPIAFEEVDNSTIIANSPSAIRVTNGKTVSMEGCTFKNLPIALTATNVAEIKMHDNKFENVSHPVIIKDEERD